MALWAREWGRGPVVLFIHGSLGDSRLWEPVARLVAEEFRSIVYDQRFFGRSSEPSDPWSPAEDALGVLNDFGIERAAVVGLSGGGKIAIDLALAHPERVWAIAHVSGAVTDMGFSLDFPTGVDDAMERDFAIWAPLGVDDTLRELWRATPKATGLDEGYDPLPSPDASGRLVEIAVPTLFVTAMHDPQSFKQVARSAAAQVPDARLIEIDSDHYLTVRDPPGVAEVIIEFLRASAS
jgi:3-oxoadipate enol-lactonase